MTFLPEGWIEKSVRRHERTRAAPSCVQELTHSMIEVVREAENKIEPPPTWNVEVSIDGWVRSVTIWARKNVKT